jgi:hypothetical protein
LQLWHVYNDNLPFLKAAREQLRQCAEEIRRGSLLEQQLGDEK